jgi:uncharacterized protein (TIGR03435 family)
MEVLVRNTSFAHLMALAFDMDVNKVVAPPGAPTGGYDLLMTGPDGTKEKLQAEIRRQLGYAAHIESRPTDVLVLTLRQTGAPGLQPSKPGGGGSGGGGSRGLGSMSLNFHNMSIAGLVRNLQSRFQQPILDRSGLTGNYDVMLNATWETGATESDALIQALSAQLGLALTPGREPLDLLIVEAAGAN